MLNQTSTESVAVSGTVSSASSGNGICSRVPAQVHSTSISTTPQVNLLQIFNLIHSIMSPSQVLAPTLTTGPAQRAAMVAATSFIDSRVQPIRRNTLLSFDELMTLRLLRNSNPQPMRSAPPSLINCDAISNQAHPSGVILENSMSALAALQSEAAHNGREDVNLSTDIAGPATVTTSTSQTNGMPPQTSILQRNEDEDDSESDKSSGGEDLSTLLDATKTRSATLLPNSQGQTHRVTSPPQAVTARNAAATCQSKPNGSFYSAPQQKRQRRAAAPAPAPEKKLRKEIKAKNPSKRGYK